MATSNSNTPVSRVQAGENKASATEAGALAGSNGTGNALSDDTTTTGVLSVSAIRTGAVSATGVAGTIGVALQGLYGSLTINQNGTYVYVVDNSNAAVNALAKGKSLQESFTYTASNGSASAQAAIVVKVNGANDVATITGLASGAVLEDGATATASGKLTVTDVDLGESLVKTDNEQSGEYGKFSITPDGAWTYVLNKNSSDVQSLSAGETVTEKFVVTSKDGSASQNVIVTVTGTNDVARIEGDARGSLTEDGKKTVARGELSIKDTDHGESAARVVTNQAGTYGAFSVDAKGGWTYVLNNSLAAVQALAQGAKGSDSFVVWSKDGSTSQTVTMTISGINDVATITGADTGSVNEDASPNTATGKLTVNDVDLGENTVVPVVNRIGSFGSFSIAADGTWTYTLNNSLASVQALGAGVVRTETFTVYSKDSQLPSLHGDDNDNDDDEDHDDDSDNEDDHDEDSGDDDHQTADYHGASKVLTVTIIGTNDAAVITGSSTGAVTEDLSLAASGQFSAADLDTGEIGFRAQSATAGAYGNFSLDAGGNWTYGLNNAAANVQALAANQTATETFTVKSFDGTEKLVTVTVTGTNDTASISGTSTGSATEDTGLTSSGTLTVSDVDHGQAVVQAQANTAGVYGSFHIASDGSWTYALSNAAANVQALAAGEQVTDGFTVLSQDGSASQVVTVNITGSNDAPIVAATDVTGAVTEQVTSAGDLTDSGTITFTDVDLTDAHSISAVTSSAGALGALSASVSTDTTGSGAGGVVSWNYSVADSAVEYLAAGQTTVETFSFNVLDGQGGSIERTVNVNVNVNGTNDIAAITGSSTGTVTEDTTLTTSGSLTVSDVDTGEAVFRVQTAASGTYGSFSIGTSGNWTYTLNNSAANVQALNTAAHVSDNFTVLSKDGSASQSVSVALTGTNDAPVLQGTQTEQLYTSSLSVWTPFLVNNGVWVTPNGASDGDSVPHTFVRQFTAVQNGNYVFEFAVDNEGSVMVDGVAIPGLYNRDWAASTVQTVALTAGIHTVTMNALNWGGPAAFAMNITDPSNHEIWNTRTHLDPEPLILSYTENQAAMVVSAGLTLTDVDSPTMTHATVAVGTGFAAGQDVLGFANQNGISGAYDASTGVLNLSGSATQAQYQAALRSVTYSNSSDSPSTADRPINFTVDDGSGQSNLSNTVQGKIIVLAVNDAPRGAATVVLAAGTEDTAYTVSAANLLAGFSDVDTGDILSVSSLAASNGTVTANANGTFTITPTANFNGAVTLNYNVVDSQGASVATTQSYTLAAVNDAPVNGLLFGQNYVTFSGDDFASTPAVTTTTNNVTLEGWFNWSGGGASLQTLLYNGNTSSQGFGVMGKVVGDQLQLIGLAGGRAFMESTDASLSANEWHYVALARTTGVFHLFVDGLEHAITNSTTAVNTPTSGALTMIGGNNVVASETFSGSIGAVKIVNTGLNGDAMGRRGEMYTEGSSGALVANWRFNDGSGNIALDSQGPTLENLTISGTPTWVTNNANGWTSVLHANEDLPVRFGALSVSDVDAGSQPVSVTLSVLHGVLSPADQGGTLSALGLMVAGWDTPTFTLTGTLSGINAALSHGIYYTGAANYNGNDTLTITTSDKGNTGTDPGLTGGTGFEQDVDSIPITVAAVNDAPVITSTAPAATGAVKEDTTLSATGQLSATDVDQGTTLLWSVLGGAAGAYGSLAVNGATGQWTYSLANSSSAVQSLGAGETHNEQFTVQVSDGNGGLATQLVTVAVTGTNPTPISEWMANGTALDSIAPANNGTMLNGVAFAAGRNGGQAFSFDGLNDYVSVVREIGGDFTITGWLNTNVQAPGGSQFYSGDGLVYADVGGLAADFGVSVLGDRLAFGAGGYGDQTIVSTSSVTSGQWVSFAAVHSGSTISLYVNGTLEASTNTGYPYALTSPSKITFGANTVDGRYYQGLLDDVSFYDSALPSAEIIGIAHTNPV